MSRVTFDLLLSEVIKLRVLHRIKVGGLPDNRDLLEEIIDEETSAVAKRVHALVDEMTREATA